MRNIDIVKIIGIAGILLVLGGYYLLWVPVDAELNEVILRTRIAIMMNLFGCVMVLLYMYKR